MDVVSSSLTTGFVNKKWYVYILKSIKIPRFYFGVTNDVKRRFHEHNSGMSKSTAPYRPFSLMRVERFRTIKEAYAREICLKSKKNKKVIECIISSSPDVLAEQEVGIPILRQNYSDNSGRHRDSVGRAPLL